MPLVPTVCIQILSADGTQEVGKITKQWSGLAKEYFTDADNFGIQCKWNLLAVKSLGFAWWLPVLC